MNIQNAAQWTDLQEVKRTMEGLASRTMLKDVWDDFADVVKRGDLDSMVETLHYVKKDLGKLVTKDELLTRLRVLNSEFTARM